MGFYSQVQISAEPKAFELFSDVLKKYDINFVTRGDEVKVINIGWIKWYPDFDEVREVEELCRKLRDSEFDKKGYGYKMMILNGNDTHEEWCNDTGDARFCDVYFRSEIYNPFDV